MRRAILLAVLLAVAVPAGAATKRPPLTGDPIADIKNAVGGKVETDITKAFMKPFQDMADFIGNDNEGAIALATIIPDLQDGNGQQCWMAMKLFGDVVKAHPVPLTLKVQSDIEAARLLSMAANRLCADVHCTQVFADLSVGVQQLAPVKASLPIPSLHDFCANVPQIAVVPAVTVPAPAAPAAPK